MKRRGPVDARVCFVGDSYVVGVGDPACRGWVGRICRASAAPAFRISSYPLGVRAQTSADIRRRWRSEVSLRLDSAPGSALKRVVFSFGVNDTVLRAGRSRVSPLASVANARAILAAARSRYSLLMIGPSPTAEARQNGRIGFLSAEFRNLCAGLKVPYLDVFTPLSRSALWKKDMAAGDGAHPGPRGYALLARLVLRWPAWSLWRR